MNIEKQNTMTEMFRGYCRYADVEYKRIWKRGIIIVDTNILLNFYKYSKETREAFFEILDKSKDRLWIPYQVGKEFFRNRETVMVESYNEYDKMIERIKTNMKEAENEINSKKNNQLECKHGAHEIIEDALKKVEELLESEKNGKKPNYERDKISEHIVNLFNENIGNKFKDEEFETIKKEGLRRMENDLPPGYRDKKKDENGDYYIFYSMMQKAKEDNRDVIFVTDDIKEDWFNIYNGERHGGRYELLDEFYKETDHLLLIYTSEGFAKEYEKNNNTLKLSEKVIGELKDTGYRRTLMMNDGFDENDYFELFTRLRRNYDYTNNNIYKNIDKLIRESEMSNEQRLELYNKLIDIKTENLENNDHQIEELLSEIKKVEQRYKRKSLLKRYKNRYKNLIRRLQEYSSKEERDGMIELLTKTIEKHIWTLRAMPGNGRILASIKLEEILTLINDKQNSIERIIYELERILNTDYLELF